MNEVKMDTLLKYIDARIAYLFKRFNIKTIEEKDRQLQLERMRGRKRELEYLKKLICTKSESQFNELIEDNKNEVDKK